MSIVLFPAQAQTGGLKVIVSNERESGEVCVFSASKTLPCEHINRGDSEVFQFAPNAIPVGEEFQVCLQKDFCVTDSNSPENEPEYVTLPIPDFDQQPSDTGQPPQEAQPSDTDQPQNQEIIAGDTSRLVPISVLIAVAAGVIGIVIKKLSRNKVQDERRGDSYGQQKVKIGCFEVVLISSSNSLKIGVMT